MKDENLWYIMFQLSILCVTATARTVKDLYEKKVIGKLGGFMSFIVSIVAGLMLALLVSVYTDEMKWISLGASIGAWSGAKTLDLLADFIHDKFNLKNNGEDR